MSERWETKNFYGGLTYDRGWFEHMLWGDEYGGSLTFEKQGDKYVLVDYDGIAGYVPNEICDLIELYGIYDMSYGRDPEVLNDCR